MRKHLFIFVAMATAVLMGIPIQEVFAQSCTEGIGINGFGGTAVASTNIGQSFTACGTGRLNTVAITARNTSSATMYCRVHAGEGTSGAFLGQTGDVAISKNRVNRWDLSVLNIQVVAGQKYTMMFYASYGTPEVEYSNSLQYGYYAGGRLINYGAANNDMAMTVTITGLSSSVSPANAAVDVSRNMPLIATFSRAMQVKTGHVYLKNLTALTTDTISVDDLIVDGINVTIPSEILDSSSVYEVIIPANTLESYDGIQFTGIASGSWKFTTGNTSVASISTSANEITNLSTIPFMVNFTESVSGFEATDLLLTNASVSGFTGSGTSFSFNIIPDSAGLVSVKIPSSATIEMNDSAEYSLIYDNVNPSVVLTSSIVDTTSSLPFTIMIAFSDPVSGFTYDDISLSNADSVSFTNSGDTLFTVGIRALAEGDITISVPSGVANEVSGNGNTSSNVLNLNYKIDVEDGVFSYYPFNGITIDVNALNPELIASAVAPTSTDDHHGQPNGAYAFNGGVLQTASFSNMFVQDGFSISTWFKPNAVMDLDSDKRLIYEHATNKSSLYYEAGQLYFTLNSTVQTYSKLIDFSANAWYHVVVTAKAGGKVFLYVNNVEYDLGFSPLVLDKGVGAMTVGGKIVNSANESPLYAMIDELKFYGKPLNKLEVAALNEVPAYDITDSVATICSNTYFVTPEGRMINTAGDYYFIQPVTGGLDQFVLLSLSVVDAPVVSAMSTTMTLCEGNSVALYGSGADFEYQWDNQVVDSVSFTIDVSETYTVVGFDSSGCSDTSSISLYVAERTFDDVAVNNSTASFCPDGSSAATISIPSSALGVEYSLRKSSDNSIVDGPYFGSIGAIDFTTDSLDVTTTYNVFAHKPVKYTFNKALSLDAVNDYLITDYTQAATDSFTIESWVFPRSDNYDRIISSYPGGGSAVNGDIIIDTYDASKNDGTSIRVYITGTGNVVSINTFTGVLTKNSWNHIAVSFDLGNVTLYVNGVEYVGVKAYFTSLGTSPRAFAIGEDNGVVSTTELLNGKVDEVRFWNSVRTKSEIVTNMDKVLTGTETGLAAYFNFNEGSGTTTSNKVSNVASTILGADANTVWVDMDAVVKVDGCDFQMTQEVTIGDTVSPTIDVHDITIHIDPVLGKAILETTDIDNGSSDNCAFDITLSENEFMTLGKKDVIVTVVDFGGNKAVDTIEVDVKSYLYNTNVSIQDTALCSKGNTTKISIDSSLIGVEYFLNNSMDSSVVQGPISGDGNPIEFTTSPLNTNTSYYVSTKVGKGGNASISLSGASDYISAATPTELNYVQSYSFETWVKSSLPGTNQGHHMLFYAGGVTGSDIEVYIQEETKRLVVVHNRGNNGITGFVLYQMTIVDQFYHLAYTYNGQTMIIYINGVAVVSGTVVKPVKNANSELTFGHANSSAFTWPQTFNGQMDDIRVWNDVRTPSEIANNYMSCLNGDEQGLVLNYTFEDVEGNTIKDKRGMYDGLLKNGSSVTYPVGVYKCGSDPLWLNYDKKLNVSVTEINNMVDVNGFEIIAQQEGASYQWLNCDDNHSVIGSANDSAYVVMSSGNFAVEVSLNNCVDTSDCEYVVLLGQDSDKNDIISISPNPARDYVQVTSAETIESVYVYNTSGVLVATLSIENGVASVSHLATGIYTLQINTASDSSRIQFVKE